MPKDTNGAHSSCSSTLVCTGNTKGLGRLEDNTKVVRADGQVSKGLEGVMEGDEATRMLYAHSHPVQLTTKHRKLIRMPARMVSLSTMSPTAMALQPTLLMSMVPCPPNYNPNLNRGHSVSSLCSFGKVIPQSLTRSSPLSKSWSLSTI